MKHREPAEFTREFTDNAWLNSVGSFERNFCTRFTAVSISWPHMMLCIGKRMQEVFELENELAIDS